VHKREEATHVFRRLNNKLPVSLHYLRRRVKGPEGWARAHDLHGVESEEKRCDDAKIATPATYRPEEVGIFLFTRCYETAIGEHMSAPSRLSTVRPKVRVRWPIPPPSVRPAAPVLPTVPLGVAIPKACVAWSTSAQTQPPSTRTVHAEGSTRIPFIRDRSITRPSSQIPSPPPLCPPPRIAVSRPLSRPKFTAAMTSATSTQRAIKRGRLSIIAL